MNIILNGMGVMVFFDDGERFAFFSRAILEVLPYLEKSRMSYTVMIGKRALSVLC